MNYAGTFHATFPSEGPDTHPHAYTHVDSSQTHAPADAIIVPDAQLLFHADYSRSGTDLILSRDHHEYVVHDYFTGGKRAPLASPDGAHLTADIVKALVGEVEVSQAGTSPVASQVIGHVTKLQGSATVIRNGVSVILNMGDNVEKGDVVQSGANSTVGITFIDGTVFGLSSNARMVLNEMVYDPNGSSNSSLMSLVAGTITFVAGETAKHGDMKIDTPVATMGIRGTAVLVEIDFTVPGQSGQPNASFQVLVEPDGTTGSYILFDKNTLQPIAIVNQAGQQVNINNGIINITTNPLSPDLQKLITDVFQQKFTDNTNTKSTSPATDSIIPTSNPLVIKIGENVITTQTVNVQSGSTQAPTTTQGSSTFHVSGPPTIQISNLLGVGTTNFQASGEQAGLTGSPLPDGAVGIVNFNDINVGDRPTVSAAFDSFTYKNAHGQDVTAGLSALQLADIAATEAKLTIVPGANNTNVGSAFFIYSVADQSFDFLAAGEQITLTYLITVNENYAPDPSAKITVPITVTITGTNDVPVITTSAQTIGFTPSGTKTVGGDLQTKDATSGTLAFTDVDLTDTHTVATKLTGAVMSNGGTVPPLPESVFEAALSAAIGIDSTGTGAGTINWQLAPLPVYLSDFIPPGQTLTLTYTITVTDSQGAISTQTVTVTITGNDSPAVVWIHTTTDGHDNLWTTATNWETGTLPTSTDDVIIITDQLHPNTPAYPVTIDGTTNAAANSVTMNDFVNLPPELDVLQGGSLTIVDALSMSADSILHNAGTVSVGGKIELLDSVDANGNFLALNQSVIVNSGTLNLGQGGDFQGLASLTNTGTIDLTGGILKVQVDIANSGTDANGKPVGGQITIGSNATLALSTDTNKCGGYGGITGGSITIVGELDLQGSNFVDSGTLSNSGNVFVTALGNSFDAETITNSGTIELKSGASLAIDKGSSVSGSGTITIDATATLTLDDATISGNTIDDNSSTGIDVAGASTINGNATLNNGTMNVDAKLTLDTMTVSGTTINDNSGGSIVLDHTVELTGGATIQGSSNALGTITNLGTLEISGTAELLDDSLINGAGIIQVDDTGTLTLDGTVITGGAINDYDAKGGGIIHVTGDSTINGGATLTKGGVTIAAGKTLTLDNVTVTGTTFADMAAGATLALDGGTQLTLNGATIHGGAINDGTSSVGATIDVTGNSTIDSNATLNNGGVTIEKGIVLTLDDVTVNGTSFVVDGAVPSSPPAELILQDGTSVSGSQITIDSNDKLVLDQATITGGSITNGDTIEVRGSSKIQGTTNQSVVTAATLSNGGVTVDADKTLTLDNVTVTGTTFTDTANGATLTLDDGTQLTLAGATIHGGTIIDGTLAGTAGQFGAIEVKSSSTIDQNATLSNGGVAIDAGQTLTLDDVTASGTGLTVAGTGGIVQVESGHALTLEGGALITAGDTYDHQDTAELVNAGRINVESSAGAYLARIAVSGAGTIQIDSELHLYYVKINGGSIQDNGILQIDGGGSAILNGTNITGGNVDVGAITNLTLDSLTVTDTTITGQNGSSLVQVSGANPPTDTPASLLKLSKAALDTLTVSGGGAIEIIDDSSINDSTLSVSQVTVDTNKTLTLDNTTASGSFANGGTIKVDANKTLTLEYNGALGGGAITGGTLINSGKVDVNGALGGEFDITSLITNYNSFEVTNDGHLKLSSTTVTNTGTVTIDQSSELDLASAGILGGNLSNAGTLDSLSGSNTISAAVTNTGTIEVKAGTLDLAGGVTGGGHLIVDAGATLELGGADANTNGTIQVDDTGTLTLSGTTITGGAINDYDTAGGGIIHVTGDSTIDGSATLTKGTVNVDAKLTLATMTVSGTTINDNSDGSIELDNTVQLTGGATIRGSANKSGAVTNSGLLEILGAATFAYVTVANASGNIQIDSGQTLDYDNSTINSGTLTVTGELDSTGTSSINNATIINQNNIHVISGTLTIDPTTVTNSGTVLVDKGATLDLQSSEIEGGNITVNGELDSHGNSTISGANIVNDGIIDVKDGSLTIDAASMSGTGSIKMDGGSLDLKGALVGDIDISGDATVELGSSSSSAYSSATVIFDQGSTGTLKLDFAEDFGGHIAGFNTGQTLDLADIAYSSESTVVYTGDASGGVLAVYVDGKDVANIHFTGDYLGVQWNLSSDGQHGTKIGASEGVLAATLDHSTAQQGVTMHVTGVTDSGTVLSSGVSYSWQTSTDGQSWTPIGSGPSFTPGEAQEGHLMQLVVTYTNALGTQQVAYALGMPNDLAVTVDQTTAEQGLPIHVTGVTDGGTPVSHGVTYLWETSADSGQHWTQVGDSSSYTPSFTNDGGKLLQLVVSYSDPGESESVTQSFGTVALAKEWTGGNHSWETGSAWNSAGAPTSSYDALIEANGHVIVDQNSAAAHSLVENASQATVEIAFGGKLTLGGNLVIDQGHFQVDLGGTLKDIADSATITGAFTNNGMVEAGGGKLEITDAVSGFGGFKIDSGATLQLDHASSASVTFSGQGTLTLEDPTHFTGFISDSTGSMTDKDVLDLAGFDTKASVTYVGGTSLGVVFVSENGKVASIAVGANTTHWTKPVSDGHGGILIEDPVQNDAAPNADTGATPTIADNTDKGTQPPTHDASHAWSPAGADGFVFKTDPGTNTAFEAGHSPVWLELGHPDAGGKVAQVLQNHGAAELPNIPGLHDGVTPDGLKAQLLLHHNEFHFV